MKLRRTLITAAVGLAAISASASDFKSEMAVGVHGGCNLARTCFSPAVKQDMAVGALAGVSFRFISERHFGVQGELNFAQSGWKENFDTPLYHYRRTLNYLRVPLLSHIYFGNGPMRFTINLGPEFGYMLGEKTTANFNPANTADLPSFPNTNRFNTQLTTPVAHRLDYGITAGLGAEAFVAQQHSVALEARFYYGLGNIFWSARQDPFSASNQLNIAVTLAYRFHLKR